ncbi:peptidase m61 domain-containing protein [Cercophora newfieldiana]|uniref:Peptidase m61 domain-containing protein n=1 Tax=Cercophora newfieldiana TaxID=92897 RepID=A0AA40CYX2_9PEZI|nr:peptidase m61 domain-containing protein [Cercophora newfieldiana]
MVRIIQISVDLTEAHRSLLHTTVSFPVQPGTLATFTTPLWIQESHSPNGPVSLIAGLRFFDTSGKTISWRRNPRAATQYLVQVPEGVDTLSAAFDSVLVRDVARHRVILRWEHVLMYPLGRDVRKLRIQPTVKVPAGWGVATALENVGREGLSGGSGGDEIRYGVTSVVRLEDSPVLAGRYLRTFEITGDGKHVLALVPDREEYNKASPEVIGKLAKLVEQTELAFGPRHYDRFWMLVSLSDVSPGSGREHHDSFDSGLPLSGLDTDNQEVMEEYAPIISHEYVHSWCGKFRRPAGHAPHDFSAPLDGRLLWVYEGLTQYYGQVLAVRSGLISRQAFFTDLAQQAAWLAGQAGRQWRSVEDTGTGVSLPWARGLAWGNWMRFGDFYMEGLLVWLDVDTLIREKTGSKRSLDDFARSFFGREGPTVVPYTLDDIVEELEKVVSHDWQSFFQTKIVDVTPEVNVDGITRSGYAVVLLNEPGLGQRTERATQDAIWNSIGIRVAEDGVLSDVLHGGPADLAKLAPTQTIVKVGEAEFSVKALTEGVTLTLSAPIRLTVKQEDDTWEVELRYDGGLRYPRVIRCPPSPSVDFLSAILKDVEV